MNTNILALPGVALLFICHVASAQTAPKSPSGQRNHAAGAPIPTALNVPRAKDAQQSSKAWCKRVMLDEYNKIPNPDPRVAQFIRDAVEDFHSMKQPPAKLKADALLLADAGVDDPLFNYLAAGVLGEPRRDLYSKAMAGIVKSPYNKIIFYMASVAIDRDLDALKAPQETRDAQFKTTLGLLRAALETDAFKPNETDALLYRLDSTSGEFLFSKHGAEVCNILKASAKVPPWVAEYCEGKRHVDEAWRSRGTDWAGKVKPEGWKGFADHLAEARIHLVKSWKLNPANPRAATEMIAVAMGESERTDTMRNWFDRAVAAQMDWPRAYSKMRWGLRPRWLGSIEEMLSFGEECVRTGRYDTGVPYEYVLTVKDASVDSDDKGAILADPKINEKLLEVLTAYLGNDQNTLDHKYVRAMAAIVAYKGGKLDVAKQHMEAIGYNVKAWSDEFGKFVEIPVMVAEIRDYKSK